MSISQAKPPVVVYSCTGEVHLIYCVWSVRSLRACGHDVVEIVVSNSSEKVFIRDHLGEVPCEVVAVDLGGYRPWTYRAFALDRYRIKQADREVVVCDTDILWNRDPAPLFGRFHGKPWVHKITSLNPADFRMSPRDIPISRAGLITMMHYKQRVGLSVYPSYHLNCGLFMLSPELFPRVVRLWVDKVRQLPPREMIMTEALLSLVYAEMGLVPICDRADIKHLGIRHDPVDVPVARFEVAETPDGASTGYETATHYHGDQRPAMHREVACRWLDVEGLLRVVERHERNKRAKRLFSFPGRVWRRIVGSVGS
jgi:hypothetical protein